MGLIQETIASAKSKLQNYLHIIEYIHAVGFTRF